MPTKVLTADTASAPADSTAAATAPMSVTLGLSLTTTHRSVTWRDRRGDARGLLRVAPEVEAVGDVGAGDVELVAIDPGRAIEDPHAIDVLVGGGTGDVDDHRASPLGEARRIF